MKIAQINPYYVPEMVGGIEWYVRNISKELVKKGHEIHVFSLNVSQGKSYEKIEEIHVHRIPALLDFSYRLKFWPELYRKLLNTDFDVVHVYDYAQFHTGVSILSKYKKDRNKKDRKIVLTVADIHQLIPRPFHKYYPLLFYDKYISRFIFRQVDKILVRTPILLSYLKKMKAPLEKISITPSGIKSDCFNHFDGNNFRSRYGIEGNLILYVGRLHPMKGPQYLIKAIPTVIKENPGTKFVFIGSEQLGMRKWLEKLIEKMGLQNYVLFLGPIYDFKQKMEAYAACDMLALPSGYEGFGQVLLEAMAQGKPVVSTDRGSIPYIIKDGEEGILVEYENYIELAMAINKLLSSPELRKEMGEKGEQKARKFTYEKLVDKMEEIYEELTRPRIPLIRRPPKILVEPKVSIKPRKSLKIAQISPYFVPVIGGMEKHVYHISKEMVNRGHKVSVFTSDRDRHSRIRIERDKLDGVEINRFRTLVQVGEFAYFWPSFVIKLLEEEFDIIHVHNYRHPHSDLALLTSKIRNKPCVITTHAPFHPSWVRKKIQRSLVKIYDHSIGRIMLNKYDLIVAITSSEFNHLKAITGNADKIKIIPNGIELEALIQRDGSKFREKYNIDGKIISFIGRIHPVKGIHFLTKAFSKIKNVIPNSNLVIAGPIQDIAYYNELVRLGKRLNTDDGITFLGKISEEEKYQMFAASDLVVLPSVYEPFGITILEAMAQSRPVVSTRGGPSDIIDEGITGYIVKYGDTKGLTKNMVKLLEQPDLARKLGENAKRKANVYTWEKITGNLLDAYSEIS